eukprot:CAMPEP_0167749318 /NCGR_PEP_ID=MMETSP0110_2-20121227/5335_1 /TAXON_ID=629695 /ORGANISM="Gymnochlora sp., Strain CCMP2014" /LENGTH=171 /DNA_ID=CAMNT_0007634447 /DNA_START=109 /DNA_END=624 /DNA_ORIENTATION=+
MAAQSSNNKTQKVEGKSAAMRMAADFASLELSDFVKTHLDAKKNLLDFKLSISPPDGFWKGGTFNFRYEVPDTYPYKPPKITCLNKIYHPNIDYQGKVCLNILRKDWKPVLDTNMVIHGLVFLFHEPEPTDPLNEDAAKVMRDNPSKFREYVRTAMRGGYVTGEKFDRVIK